MRPKISGPSDVISSEAAANLEAVFSEDEIWAALKDCDGNKTPGPDGFNLACVQKCWPVMKSEIVRMFHEFHTNAKLSTGINSSFIVLIPKRDNSSRLGDYRPISLVSSIYKILAKVLSKRVKQVLSAMISEVQWIRWMKTCITTTMVSTLVNGAPTEEFQPQKGLWQGDPLSPFLFIVVAEGLNLLLERAIEKGLIKGASVGSDQFGISHLQFADDTIIFCEGGMKEVLNTKRVLRLAFRGQSQKKEHLVSSSGEVSEEALFLEEETGVVKSISKIQANFLWGGSATNRKVHMVKWKEVTKSKNQGGLGVRDLSEVNECLLLKWWWKYGSDDKALWKSVIYSSLRVGVEDSCSSLAKRSMQFSVASVWRWRAAASGLGLAISVGVWCWFHMVKWWDQVWAIPGSVEGLLQ
ncbi:uncharacterized protein LOC114294021 [Camellia sinensis]|uniref:uncharacterized protein LOC114294021 n=1 Tax=Camellia sinensis TaxID=4442 RepID=UPI001035C23A|nr:uncharacterized protein LOC114294021 [Camellia sinensis]